MISFEVFTGGAGGLLDKFYQATDKINAHKIDVASSSHIPGIIAAKWINIQETFTLKFSVYL